MVGFYGEKGKGNCFVDIMVVIQRCINHLKGGEVLATDTTVPF